MCSVHIIINFESSGFHACFAGGPRDLDSVIANLIETGKASAALCNNSSFIATISFAIEFVQNFTDPADRCGRAYTQLAAGGATDR